MTSGEDVGANLRDLIQNYSQLAKQDTQLVVTPENSLFMRLNRQTPVHPFKLSAPEILEIQKHVDGLSVPLIVGSIPLEKKEGQKFSNAMIHFQKGKRPEVVYEKIHLFDVDVVNQPAVRESEVFDPGQRTRILDVNGFKLGLSICYDLRFSDLYLEYARAGVDGILIPSAFLVPTGEAHWHVLIRARAIESQCYVIAPAQGGRSTKPDGAFRETYGHSLAVDPWGKVLIELNSENRTGVVELQRASIEGVRAQIPMAKHRRKPT